MSFNTTSFNQTLKSHWRSLSERLQADPKPVHIDGRGLDLAAVVVVARYGKLVNIGNNASTLVLRSAEAIHGSLGHGEVIYGINTGFGGSADTRTQAVVGVQRGLIRGLHYGILAGSVSDKPHRDIYNNRSLPNLLDSAAMPLDDPVASTSMPETWTRASMVIRLNSLCMGASGVRPLILSNLAELLNKDVVPLVPLRGSISASGDLSPLSYIGGTMQGKPALKAYVGSRSQATRKLITADRALMETGVKPIDVGPKEGLAIVNGTAPSAAVAALALHEVYCQALLSQILTAMSVEALCGTDESFNPFFAEVRPHEGQRECARNILFFLSQSQLVASNEGVGDSLRQDRYAIRTAPQWIGPVLEDLVLAYRQIVTEINSATDNPLINAQGKMLHGGNFQAKSVTSAMEKTRQTCQTIGQMSFAQCTELINPATSRGLPPNLVVDEPSESWMWKGTDIYIAALQSELGYLSNPAGSHVQFAEMGNQSLNSLALISARYTLTAVDVLTQLSAAHLVALCQALDLRALHVRFLHNLEPEFREICKRCLESALNADQKIETLSDVLWSSFTTYFSKNTTVDSGPRITAALDSLVARVLRCTLPSHETLTALENWTKNSSNLIVRIFDKTRADYLQQPDALPVLGLASRRLYKYIRQELKVPFFGEESIRSAEWEAPDQASDGPLREDRRGSRHYHSMGEMITAVYQAMRSGALYAVAMECLEDSEVSSTSFKSGSEGAEV